jgi:hypothetical protein
VAAVVWANPNRTAEDEIANAPIPNPNRGSSP